MDPETKDRLLKKIEDSKKVIREALKKFQRDEIAITWTGGKDSTLALWLFRQVCSEDGIELPIVLSIDEYDHFPEIHDFIDKHAAEWGLNLVMAVNKDVVEAAGGKLGAPVRVAALNQRNQAEVQRLGWEEDEFPFEAESYVGNHLMKTVPFNQFIEEHGIKAVVQGLRWDEQAARAHDEYFTYREPGELSPGHWRINPILHFTERDVWNTNRGFGVPYNELYAQGYRSLGAKSTSKKFAEVPAWEQDLENTGERDGRRQDKEAAMDKLRSLGYM
ncbi:MAG: phosphoadenosine phosphosulfate reductase family protein [Desulfarculus sp.]|jgi:phosphoadenosine phosphosulfate reductase|nr:MAG: phosphoadenosine phosphosulfate reductase family protein [Desulfarculus sp.]